jgi:hypothetical protein
MDSQNKQILAHLQRGDALTPIEALTKYGCFRLASRIHELRTDGHDIMTIKEKTPSGKYIARYSLQ